MTDVDRAIACLTSLHDQLAELVASMGDDDLARPSGAAQWQVHDVLSHLGSGAEITIRPFQAAVDGVPVPSADNEAIWARWNEASPSEQASWFVQNDTALVSMLGALTDEQRGTLTVDLGFLPQPVPLVVAVGMRLNEVALHAWDIRAAFDPDATLDDDAAELLFSLYAGELGFLLGFVAKPDAVERAAVVDVLGHGLVVEESVALVADPPVAPTARYAGSTEAAVRLLTGRLSADRTPPGVAVTGNLDLDDLRLVFPGY